MNNFIKNCNLIFKNPIIITLLLIFIVSIILFFTCNFNPPDYYTDRKLADSIAQTVLPKETDNAVHHLLNNKYSLFNPIFKFWGALISFLIFCFCFKIDTFKKFSKLTVLNNKKFVYSWINLSYPVWAICYINVYMNDIEKYVYNGRADSFGIPFFSIIFTLATFGIIYYSFMNFISYITFNTKIKRLFYYFLWIIPLFVLIAFILDDFSLKFSCFQIPMYLCYFVWLMFIIYSIGYIKEKENCNSNI